MKQAAADATSTIPSQSRRSSNPLVHDQIGDTVNACRKVVQYVIDSSLAVQEMDENAVQGQAWVLICVKGALDHAFEVSRPKAVLHG
ncbi:MAG TPA: hypothetical protein VFA75_12760 [Nevskia sp.]|nr:hypothetical protein [Nevskia sp.]